MTSRRRFARGLSRGAVTPGLLLLLCCLSPVMPVAAGRDLQEAPLPAGELDRAFEVEVYQLLQQRPGSDAARITRIGNTLLLTG